MASAATADSLELKDRPPSKASPKASSTGITLVPQPSDDPGDPLNWSQGRKVTITLIWCIGTFASAASGLGNTLGYFVQASVYHVQPIDISYSVVAATAGIAVGPLFAVPLACRHGKSFVFFWSMVGLLVTGVWSATMTGTDDYIAFVLARFFGGFVGGNATALGASTMMDMFFLHQRGKALTVLNLSFLLGIVVGPTFSGFIVASAPWPVQFWWTTGLEAIVIVLALLFLDDTTYDRTQERIQKQDTSSRSSFLRTRSRAFFWGAIINSAISWQQTAKQFLIPFLIGISPVTILCGGFTFIDFGFSVFFNIVLTVFLQDPISSGGYGFNPTQNAAFLFSLWFGIFLAQFYGYLANDRLPLLICRRKGGIWQPEYRLYSLVIPGLFVLPISLGLYGASLQYHLHFMVLAVACFLGGFASNAIIPITVTYVVESFKGDGAEVAAILGIYRLTFVIVLPFFVTPWMTTIGSGWALGMAAFFSVAAFGLVVGLIWKGPVVRGWSVASVSLSEDGFRLMDDVETPARP